MVTVAFKLFYLNNHLASFVKIFANIICAAKKIESKTTAKLSLDVIALLRTYEIEVCRHSQVN